METEHARFTRLLRTAVQAFHLLNEAEADALYQHFELLRKWNRTLNLTRIGQLEVAVTRHYAESLFLAAHLSSDGSRVADIGSGAGFPGFPIAVVQPAREVTLVESHSRKAVFLREASRAVRNVRVVSARAESLEGVFHWWVSRAVSAADMRRILRGRLGRLAFLVGAQDVAEWMAMAGSAWATPVPVPWGNSSVLLIGEIGGAPTGTGS
jgi:16S rRNA (guanine527-N7)-methyltransferase